MGASEAAGLERERTVIDGRVRRTGVGSGFSEMAGRATTTVHVSDG